MCDGETLMVVDFERAKFHGHQPLGPLDPDGRMKKRKRGTSRKQGKDGYAEELESAVREAVRCLGSPPRRLAEVVGRGLGRS